MTRILNISGTSPVEDPSYRYKMPAVLGKIEGKGNGIKTVLINISPLALSLHRSPGEVTKHFGCELGAQTTYNESTDRAVVNGAHTDAVLQGTVHKYIQEFVLCPNCGLPETNYSFKNGCVLHRCMACGAKEMVDMSHKLCTYILAQEKKRKQEEKKSGKKKGKEAKVLADDDEKKEKKKKKKKSKDSDDEKKKKKKKDKKKEKKKSKEKDSDSDDLADGVDDLSISSEAGVDDAGAMRKYHLGHVVFSCWRVVIDTPIHPSQWHLFSFVLVEAIREVKKFMTETPNASTSEIVDIVINQQMASALKSHDRIHIFLRSVLTPDFFKRKEIQTHAPVMEELLNSNPIMERHLIAAIEYASLVKVSNFPIMLKLLFDEDVLSEQVILEWAFDGRTDYTLDEVEEETRALLRSGAEPVVQWLAQEDSSDDESDSDSD